MGKTKLAMLAYQMVYPNLPQFSKRKSRKNTGRWDDVPSGYLTWPWKPRPIEIDDWNDDLPIFDGDFPSKLEQFTRDRDYPIFKQNHDFFVTSPLPGLSFRSS